MSLSKKSTAVSPKRKNFHFTNSGLEIKKILQNQNTEKSPFKEHHPKLLNFCNSKAKIHQLLQS
jgi:hypothetical protein